MRAPHGSEASCTLDAWRVPCWSVTGVARFGPLLPVSVAVSATFPVSHTVNKTTMELEQYQDIWVTAKSKHQVYENVNHGIN